MGLDGEGGGIASGAGRGLAPTQTGAATEPKEWQRPQSMSVTALASVAGLLASSLEAALC